MTGTRSTPPTPPSPDDDISPADANGSRSKLGSSTRPKGDLERQIRGSSLLMVGRILSMVVTILVQAVIVRALTKGEFGNFAYALSISSMLSTIITLGIDRAVPRFAAVYDERQDWGRLAGTLVIQVSSILSLGLAAIVGVTLFQGLLASTVIKDPGAVSVLVVLVAMAPVDALDQVAVALFAVYAKPRAIFFRRYLLTPVLRLTVVGVLVLVDGGPRVLAAGYVLTSLSGVALYSLMLFRLFRSNGMLSRWRVAPLALPWRAVLGYSLPLMASDLMFAVLNTSDVVLLDRYHSSEAVASYRAILPGAKLNQFVMTSFALLYTPVIARLLERKDRRGVSDVYWRTAGWISVASFPILALTLGVAGPITVAMFGRQYADSALYLQLVAVGYYFNAATGFNGLTVKTAGRVTITIAISALALVTNLILGLLLIPRYGPLGAAMASLGTLLTHNLLKQGALALTTPIGFYSRSLAVIHAYIAAGIGVLLALEALFDLPVAAAVGAAAVVSLALLVVTRRRLEVGSTFPEVARIPVLGPFMVRGGSR